MKFMFVVGERRSEAGVGGLRIEMSIAVPWRRGTRGVSSRAINGRLLAGRIGWASGWWWECAAVSLKASIRPGETITLHSSGWRSSQKPRLDQENMDAIVRLTF